MYKPLCRFCGKPLQQTFVDLGMSPLSNSYLKEKDLCMKEEFYPLHAYVCENCFLVQLEEFETPDRIFGDYAYFSSYSDSWLKHVENYTECIVQSLSLNTDSRVIEIASNDGYLLQYFNKKKIPVIGIEPAANVAKVSEDKGIPTIVKFFGVKLAQELAADCIKADLLIGNNVLAHVPDINDFVGGMKLALKPNGIITMEFPHLLKLIKGNQFDTIYHEHFSYLSLSTVHKIFASHGLMLYDVDELPTHGGSLRIYACHEGSDSFTKSVNLIKLLSVEKESGLLDISTYQTFGDKVKETKRKILDFFIKAKRDGKVIVGYGAPAKGNTLLNYCGARTDFIDYTVDRSPYKQGLYLPGTHIPIKSPDEIKKSKPDYVFILPWNLKEEIIEQMAYIREWGGKFVIPIPEVEVL